MSDKCSLRTSVAQAMCAIHWVRLIGYGENEIKTKHSMCLQNEFMDSQFFGFLMGFRIIFCAEKLLSPLAIIWPAQIAGKKHQ